MILLSKEYSCNPVKMEFHLIAVTDSINPHQRI